MDRENCPKEDGPDYDYGSSPILVALPDGRDLLLAGQKSGIVYALDPRRLVHGELPKLAWINGLVTYCYHVRDARLHRPFRSCGRHNGPPGRPRGSPFRGCRIRAAPASVADPQSRAQACAQPACHGSDHRRLDRAMAEFTSEVFRENSAGKLGL